MNLLTLLHSAVSEVPQKACLMYKQDGKYTSITYSEFWDRIMHFAAGLVTFGAKPGDKIGILSTNCPEWAISDYASLAIGAVVVPIYPTLPAAQVEFILKNADVRYLIVQDGMQLEKVRSRWPESLLQVIVFRETTPSMDGKAVPFSDVCSIGKHQNLSGSRPDVYSIPEGQLATIVHTSGTTGNPKGVMLTHSNIVSNIHASLSYLPVEKTDVSLSFLPLSHIFERTVGQFAALSSGATIAYAESIETIQQNLKEVRPTIFITVPRLLEKVYAGILNKVEKAPGPLRGVLKKGIESGTSAGLTYRLVDKLVYRKVREGLGGRLRCIVSGGSGLAADIANFFIRAGIPVHEGYGMTEAAPVICANPKDGCIPGTVGKPLPGVRVRVAEDGELLVKGPNVMQGYYKNPEATAETIDSDGWLHTGDIAEIHNGYVRIVDRKKNILVLGTGKNVAPWPVENAISLSPFITQAVLIGDKRNYVTCLLVPDVGALQSLAGKMGLGPNPADWLENPEIRKLIAGEVRKATVGFADFEIPKRAVLLQKELTLETGELTPTLKVKNQAILEKYGHLIEDMYNGKQYLPIFDDSGPSASPLPQLSGQPSTVSADPDESGKQHPGAKRMSARKIPVWIYATSGLALGLLFRFWWGE
ncbi:AMP-dependent synthetase/ligase [Effusibacillus lacus]|uniref:Long-chain fatty acid--CoA ligase n=1 Tax=Effusibacillus lacus TaxID=1348429 RepID=A0A292YK28_9BACL|nr:long-chain fatty acid--CoA ligase [Effusibacillus lacus]TCS68157.1 long-chain acyl-CoA synthetase [Effusibacillus lacus]GAX90288.1 long-chain fatty acid--CoA ligase [Effusibacillus lacus]